MQAAQGHMPHLPRRLLCARHVLALLQLLYQLIRCGFYRAPELLSLRAPLLRLLDGRTDKAGNEDEAGPDAR